MSKVPYTDKDVQTAQKLMAQGYRRTSWKHRLVSRIDRPDWVQILAVGLRRAPADFYVPGESNPSGSWCSYYRACLSEDTKTVTPEVIQLIPTTGHDPVGYIPLETDKAPEPIPFYETFDEYLKETEVFSERMERFYDDFQYVGNDVQKLILAWMKAAFDAAKGE